MPIADPPPALSSSGSPTPPPTGPSDPTSSTSPLFKRILSAAQLETFQSSQTHKDLVEFIEGCNESVRGVKMSEAGKGSAAIQALLRMLDSIEALVHSTPPADNSTSRFGNPAFKTFYDRVQAAAGALHAEHVSPLLREGMEGDDRQRAMSELQGYWGEAWGNRTRVDYGSGMELNFVCWLLCLQKLGALSTSDYRPLILRVFWRYITVMRLIQSTYWLEPAGSHGVWGLDDYHFLPFLWGSGQLDGHKHLRPKSIHDPEVLEAFSDEYMYFACIRFINSIKTASLRWHSPMLDDISAVKTWSKVNSGMIKMYLAEVLGKLPVVQHFLFGTLLPYPVPLGEEDVEEGEVDAHGHVHAKGETGWTMDCCGIPVPSAFAAAAAEKGQAGPGAPVQPTGTGRAAEQGLLKPRAGLRPIPFD